VPAERALAGRALDALHGLADVFALLLFGELPVLDPAPAVAADVEAGLTDRRGGQRITLQRQRAAEYRERQPALAEEPREAPEADAAAVFEHALGGEVAALRYLGRGAFGEAP